jgi:hypothetical protein
MAREQIKPGEGGAPAKSMRSLADVDDARQKAEQSQNALDEVLGGADVVKP